VRDIRSGILRTRERNDTEDSSPVFLAKAVTPAQEGEFTRYLNQPVKKADCRSRRTNNANARAPKCLQVVNISARKRVYISSLLYVQMEPCTVGSSTHAVQLDAIARHFAARSSETWPFLLRYSEPRMKRPPAKDLQYARGSQKVVNYRSTAAQSNLHCSNSCYYDYHAEKRNTW